MAQRLTYDYAVCGLGMAGLAVSAHMAKALPAESRVLLLDPRRGYQRDKSWCMWHTRSGLMDSAISHRWSRWLVRWRNRSVVHESVEQPYAHIDSAVYYRQALDILAQHPGFDVVLGQAAERLIPGPQQVHIAAGAHRHHAHCVFDSRPRPVPAGTLLQHFQGWEVYCEHPAFDPGTVTLMDFQTAKNGDIHFFYVLPFSHRHALVESTHFSQEVLAPQTYATEIQAYLAAQGCGRYEVVRREAGVIPMPLHPTAEVYPDPRIMHIGVTSDTTKASSGYCYAATQRQARRIADTLPTPAASNWRPVRSALGRWFDGVFVRYLMQHPERAPATFLSLFENNDADTIVRFLSDDARLSDYVAVAQSLPTLPLSKQALAYAVRA